MLAKKAKELDLTKYESVLSRIPPEFAEYVRGAFAYRKGEFDTAVSHWRALLALSPEQRKYRTLWATFMIGRVFSDKEPIAAIEYFSQCRKMVAEGVADPLNLAEDSLGWLAQAETRTKRYVDAIHHYAELAKNPDREETGILSLTTVCRLALNEDVIDPALAKDGLSSQVLTAAIACQYGRIETWAKCIEAAQVQPPILGADRVAWSAYTNGDMASAAEWLRKADMTTVHARWVQAKLFLRDGKIEEGKALITGLQSSHEEDDAVPQFAPEVWPVTEKYGERVLGDMGLLHLYNREYPEALESFARSGFYFDDALYVAECVMSIDELKAFIERHKNDAAFGEMSIFGYLGLRLTKLERLEQALASRLAVQGKWDDAIPFFPEGLKEDAKRMAELTRASTSSMVRERAESLVQMGKLLMEKGRQLIHYGIYNFDYEGAFANIRRLSSGTGLEGASEDEKVRVAKLLPKANEHFNYRCRAADLMWEAASLLPKNDLLAAEALYCGGVFLKAKDPKAADKFYKALVRRNPNLEIAQQADKLRWFPARFSNKVLYKPLPFWSKRRLALASCGVVGCAVGAALAAAYMFRRRK